MNQHSQPNQDQIDQTYKIVLAGDSGVGKSSFVTRFVDGVFTEGLTPTLGVEVKVKTIDLDGERIQLYIWEVAGGEKIRSLMSAYYTHAHGIIVFYDITDGRSFHLMKPWVREIEREGPDGARRLLVGTKRDLATEIRAIDYNRAKKYADQHNMILMETSAKDNINIEEAVITLAADIKKSMGDQGSQKTKNNNM